MVNSGRAPWWRLRQRERFARAVDSSSDAGQQPYDPTLAGELAVVVMLQRTAAATAPDDTARDRMRAKLMAELALPPRPSPVPRAATVESTAESARAESAGETPAATARPTTGPGRAPRRPARAGRVTGTRGRLVIALGAAFCLVLALSGMTLLLSRDALPGDPLYAFRRTVESASLGLTVGDDARGRKHLEFAADRVADIESLASRYPDLSDSPVGDYLTAFADFDSDAAAGTADLTGYATGNGPADLDALRTWAAQQTGRITAVEPQLPPQARTRAGQTLALLARITGRANALLARDSCYTVTSGATDDLGVLPATGPCDQAPGTTARVGPGQLTGAATTLPAQVPPAGRATAPAGTTVAPAPSAGQAPGTFTAPPVALPPVLGTSPVVSPTTTGLPPIVITLPLPLPGLNIPALLPGLPTLRVG